MKIQHEIQNGNLAIIDMHLDRAEVEDKFQKELKAVTKNVTMPGFRPGHAPKALIEQKYGASVRFEALNTMVNEGLTDYLKAQKFEFYGMPMGINSEDDKPGEDSMNFKFELGLRPAIDLKIDSNVSVTRYKVEVLEEEITKELDLIQRRQGSLGEVDTVEVNDLLNGDFTECNEDGTAFEGGLSAEKKSILLSTIKNEELKAPFMGKKVGDTVTFNIFTLFDNNTTEIASIFGIEKEAAKDLNPTFTFTIGKIQRLVLAELNEELFAKFSTEDRPVNSLDDLKAIIRTEIGKYFESQAENMMEDDLVKELVKLHNINLPDAFLLRWIKDQNKDKDAHDIEHDYLHEKEYLKWSIVRDKVFTEQGFEIEEGELEEQYQNLLSNYMQRYGYDPNMMAIRNEFETKYFKREDQQENVANMVRTQKVMAYVKQHITILENPIDNKTFDEIRVERSKHAHDHDHE